MTKRELLAIFIIMLILFAFLLPDIFDIINGADIVKEESPTPYFKIIFVPIFITYFGYESIKKVYKFYKRCFLSTSKNQSNMEKTNWFKLFVSEYIYTHVFILILIGAVIYIYLDDYLLMLKQIL